MQSVQKHGAENWTEISQALPGRVGKQCMERWHNQLNPNIKRSCWTDEEEWYIYTQHSTIGKKWALMAHYMPGRTANSIKNHWNSSMKKKIPELRSRIIRLIKQQENEEDEISETSLLNARTDTIENMLPNRNDSCSEEQKNTQFQAKRKKNDIKSESPLVERFICKCYGKKKKGAHFSHHCMTSDGRSMKNTMIEQIPFFENEKEHSLNALLMNSFPLVKKIKKIEPTTCEEANEHLNFDDFGYMDSCLLFNPSLKMSGDYEVKY